ncbi:MAG: DUF159 family protein [Clostridium sp.]|nr:DUF159 family protein [Clostridium sp.]
MCGRYYVDEETAREIWKIVGKVDEQLKIEGPGRDIHPTEPAPVIVGRGEGLAMAWQRWGYPGFAGSKVVFNARAESVMEKRMFREGIRRHRLVVPGAWFYEWNRNKEKITFRREDSPVLFMAGFCSRFEDGNRFVILTTQANDSMKGTHDRMPLILEKEQLEDWVLDEKSVERILAQRPALLEKRADYEQQTLF